MTADVTLYDGNKLTAIHDEEACFRIGGHCAFHAPSDHPLNAAPFAWFEEVRALMRVCEHGFFHPDPDDLKFKVLFAPITAGAIASVHLVEENCDDCCRTPRPSNTRSEETP